MADTLTRAPAATRRGVLGRLGQSSRWRRALSVVAALALWQIASQLADSRLMPGLDAIFGSLLEQIRTGLFWHHGRATLARGLSGFGIACVVGVLLGFVMARSRLVEAALEPFLAATYPVPKIALYPFFIFLFGLGAMSKVALVALECLYPIAYNTYQGVRGTPTQLLAVADNLGASRLERFRRVTVPTALPSFLTGVRVAVPIMLLVIVVTELIGESRGLGFLIRNFGANFQPQGALAVVAFLGVLGFVLDRGIVALTHRLVFWEHRADV